MGFTGAHVLYTFDVFLLALYLLSHGCALMKYTCRHKFSSLVDSGSEPNAELRTLYVDKKKNYRQKMPANKVIKSKEIAD